MSSMGKELHGKFDWIYFIGHMRLYIKQVSWIGLWEIFNSWLWVTVVIFADFDGLWFWATNIKGSLILGWLANTELKGLGIWPNIWYLLTISTVGASRARKGILLFPPVPRPVRPLRGCLETFTWIYSIKKSLLRNRELHFHFLLCI